MVTVTVQMATQLMHGIHLALDWDATKTMRMKISQHNATETIYHRRYMSYSQFLFNMCFIFSVSCAWSSIAHTNPHILAVNRFYTPFWNHQSFGISHICHFSTNPSNWFRSYSIALCTITTGANQHPTKSYTKCRIWNFVTQNAADIVPRGR